METVKYVAVRTGIVTRVKPNKEHTTMTRRELFLLYLLYVALTLLPLTRAITRAREGDVTPLVVWCVLWVPGTVVAGYVLEKFLNRRRR